MPNYGASEFLATGTSKPVEQKPRRRTSVSSCSVLSVWGFGLYEDFLMALQVVFRNRISGSAPDRCELCLQHSLHAAYSPKRITEPPRVSAHCTPCTPARRHKANLSFCSPRYGRKCRQLTVRGPSRSFWATAMSFAVFGISGFWGCEA